MTILTDSQGRPIPQPVPDDYETIAAYVRAYHGWRDTIATLTNSAFDHAFASSLKSQVQSTTRKTQDEPS